MTPEEQFYSELRELCAERKMSLATLSRKLGKNPRHISIMASKKISPTLKTLVDISNVLKVKVSTLVKKI